MSESKTLYNRLGGYDAIAAVVANILARLKSDPKLRRFWDHRGSDGLKREQQLLVDYLCATTGGALLYTGRDMPTTHKGMRISESDWSAFTDHLDATLNFFEVPIQEKTEVIMFIESTKGDIVEC